VEIIEGVLKKEDMSQAKVAKTFPREVQKSCRDFIKRWATVFAENPLSPPMLDKEQVEMKIPLDQDAMKDQARRMSPEQHKIVQEQVDLMMRHKIIEEIISP
jgi:hypothetical protein